MKDGENFNFGLFFVHPRWMLPTQANIYTVKNMLKHFKFPFNECFNFVCSHNQMRYQESATVKLLFVQSYGFWRYRGAFDPSVA